MTFEADRLLVVSPVRNEAVHISQVVRSMAAQTRPPDLWLVADDGSDDGTLEILRELEDQVPFMRVIVLPPKPTAGSDRLALAMEAIAFNVAVGQVDTRGFTHIGKFDGDVELPPDYFERVLEAFDEDSALGIAGGSIVEPTGPRGSWRPVRVPEYHVHGALKLYTRECFEAVGGIQERLAWDTIDETYARMNGYRTRTIRSLVVRHHRPSASAQGQLRGRARHGECAYILHYGLLWTLLRSFKVALSRPWGLSGLAFVWGYLRSRLRSTPQVDDPRFADFVTRELRARILRALLPPVRPVPTSTVYLAASFGGHLELLTTLMGALNGHERVWVTAPGPRTTALVHSGEQVRPLRLFHRHAIAGLAGNLVGSLRLVLRERPRLVITSGAGSVAPFCFFARLLGAEIIFIETTARVTDSSQGGRLIAPMSSLVIVQWPEMAGIYPGAVVCRPSLLEGQALQPPEGRGTLVAVGSHTDPFDRLLELVDRAVEQELLPRPVRAQTGVCRYRGSTFDSEAWLTPDDLTCAVESARYVVCHGGSGIIATAVRCGRKPLVVARLGRNGEHVDDHQLQLVTKLDELGLIVAVEGEITAEHVAAAASGPTAVDAVMQGELLEPFLARVVASAGHGRPLPEAAMHATRAPLERTTFDEADFRPSAQAS